MTTNAHGGGLRRSSARRGVCPAVSQRDYRNFYPFLVERQADLLEALVRFFYTSVQGRFPLLDCAWGRCAAGARPMRASHAMAAWHPPPPACHHLTVWPFCPPPPHPTHMSGGWRVCCACAFLRPQRPLPPLHAHDTLNTYTQHTLVHLIFCRSLRNRYRIMTASTPHKSKVGCGGAGEGGVLVVGGGGGKE